MIFVQNYEIFGVVSGRFPLVLIVSRTAQKNRIMKAIMDGADRRAGAIVFSLPVTDTAGLRLLEEEEPATK